MCSSDLYIAAQAQIRPTRELEPGDHEQAPPPTKQISQIMRQDPRCPDEMALTKIGSHLSLTERNSESSERDLRNYLVLDLLAEHLGDDFEGTVTGVTSMGLFVQIDRYLVDGFIKIADLPGERGDRWRLNRTTGAMVAMRSGKAISIGDRFTVREIGRAHV